MSQADKYPINLYLLCALIGGVLGMALFLPISAITAPLAAYAYSYFPGRGQARAAGFVLVLFGSILAADLGAVLGAVSGRLGYWIWPRRSATLLAAALGGLISAFLASLWMAFYVLQG